MRRTQVDGHSAGRNLSDEIFLALCTASSPLWTRHLKARYGNLPPVETQGVVEVKNETIDSLLFALRDATEDAALIGLCNAETIVGWKGRRTEVVDGEGKGGVFELVGGWRLVGEGYG